MTNTTLTTAQLEERDYQELMVNDKGFFGVTNRVLGVAASIGVVAVGLLSAVGANAAHHSCYWTTTNNHICVYNVQGNASFKTYDMNINGRYAGKQSVVCHPEHRYNYKANANGIACFEFSY